MQVPNNVKSGELGFNMTPMIDVVFLLIIFFLVSSHLAKQETQMPLPLPAADSGTLPDEEQAPEVTVNVKDDGELVVAGRSLDAAELQARLLDRVNQSGRDIEVRIRASRHAPYGSVEPVMLACARVGVWNVTYSTYSRKDVE